MSVHGLAAALTRAITSAQEERDITDGLRAIVRRYYEEYTDAEELDAETYHALKHLFDLTFGEDCEDADGKTFDEVIQKNP